MKKIIVLFMCCILFVTIAALAGCQATPTVQLDDDWGARWMGDIADNALLSALSIPGTHDSGAYRSGLIADMGKDQTYDIADQLAMGVRFLDIRLVLKKGKLGVYHGIINEKLAFETVVNTAKTFLADHPTECVLMCIKKENAGEDIAEAVHAVIDEEPSLWYTREAIPTMQQARGKIVLFRRFADEARYGVDLYSGFEDNCAFAIEGNPSCYVQDYYKLEVTDNLPTKWQKIVETFDYANTGAADSYVLNFTSAYYDKKLLWTNVPEIQKTADYIHEQYADYTLRQARYGIVLFDFVTPQLAKSMFGTNFAPAKTA